MLSSSRTRWAVAALLVVIALTVGGWWLWHGETQASATADGAPSLSHHGPLRPEADPGAAEAAADSRSRPARGDRSTAAAEARMRSLLDLKKEEMAYLELSPEAIQEVFPNLGIVAGAEDGFRVMNRVALTTEARIKLVGMVRQGMPVSGRIDTSAVGMDRTGMSNFSWQGDDWKATGVYMPNDASNQTLTLHLEGQGKELLTTVTIPDGGAFIFLKGDGHALMIVAGGDMPEPAAGK